MIVLPSSDTKPCGLLLTGTTLAVVTERVNTQWVLTCPDARTMLFLSRQTLEGTMTNDERAELMRQWRRAQEEERELTEAADRLLKRIKGERP